MIRVRARLPAVLSEESFVEIRAPWVRNQREAPTKIRVSNPTIQRWSSPQPCARDEKPQAEIAANLSPSTNVPPSIPAPHHRPSRGDTRRTTPLQKYFSDSAPS